MNTQDGAGQAQPLPGSLVPGNHKPLPRGVLYRIQQSAGPIDRGQGYGDQPQACPGSQRFVAARYQQRAESEAARREMTLSV
jgi:hypothetical protein